MHFGWHAPYAQSTDGTSHVKDNMHVARYLTSYSQIQIEIHIKSDILKARYGRQVPWFPQFDLMAILDSIRTHTLWLLSCVVPQQGVSSALS